MRHRRPLRRRVGALAWGVLGAALVATAECLVPTITRPSPAQTAPNCPLPADLAATFLNATCSKMILSQPQTFYRYYSTDGNRVGRYLTTERMSVNVAVIRSLALKQEWIPPNRATNTLAVTLPAGTAIFQGIVAPQSPSDCYPGGGQQTFIENASDPRIVWVEGPLLSVSPFSCP